MRSVAILPALLLSLAGCAHGAKRPTGGTADFSTTPPVGVDDREADRLAALAQGDGVARAVRLERLLDLFDAARLGRDDGARDVLWEALGGHGTGRGPEATREALTRLLAEASVLEDLEIADEDARLFVNDAIALLTTDLQTPAEADQLAVRTLAYRTLVTDGHPRIRDNARWRLYDHVRGTLAAALLLPPEARTDVAIQAEYVAVEDLSAALSDAGVHERARWPGATGLVALLEAQREALAKDPAWASVIETRAANDRELADAVLAELPASRMNGLVAPKRPRGTGAIESLAPIVHVSAGRIDIDAGRPQSRALPLVDDDVAGLGDAIRDALAQDGRGALLLLVDPSIPAPELRRALRGIRRGNAARVDLALLEPHADGGTVATALPITVVRDASSGASAHSLAAARVHVHVGGRGLELALDGRWLPGVLGTTDEVERGLSSVRTAYPRERAVRITIGADASHEQIVEATAALVGGPLRRFALVGWMPDESRPAGAADPATERLLADRASWAALRSVAIEQPFPLAGDDQQRLRAFADALPRCLPELGTGPAKAKPGPKPLEVRITIADGRVQPIAAPKIPGVGTKAIAAMTSCLQDEGYTLRLREHRDTIAIVLRAT